MRQNFKPSVCHPDRRHAAKGLCFPCYANRYPEARRAACHEDRVAFVGPLCRVCYDRDLKNKNPEYAAKQRDNYDRWLKTNGFRVRAYGAQYMRQPRVKKRNTSMDRIKTLARYGLTWEDEQRILDAQGHVCALCQEKPDRPRFDVDHDHKTGRFRGFICGRCNKGLGLLGDSIESLERALRYLHKAPTGSDIKPVVAADDKALMGLDRDEEYPIQPPKPGTYGEF